MRTAPLRDERGGVLVLVALVLPVLLAIGAGGVVGYALSASSRELQRAADQAALAGAVALPPLDPTVLVAGAPFPLPSTDPLYELLPPGAGEQVPRMGDLVPDPRRVACEVAEEGLGPGSAAVASAFADPSALEPPLGPDDRPRDTVCQAPVYPVIEPDPTASTPADCANRLVQRVAADAGVIGPLAQTLVRMDLNRVLPAAFTPRMRVDVYAGIRTPLLSLVAGRSSGTVHAAATARRRLKNAFVVPIFPAQRVLLSPEPLTGLLPTNPLTGRPWEPVDFMTDPVNLNAALAAQQATLIAALDDADARLDGLMDDYGLPCHHLLHNLRQDLRDLYDPPTGQAPTALELVEAAAAAAQRTAARTGLAEPDPSDPSSLAGEAFLIVGVAVDEAMRPLAATQVPVLDVALVSMRRAADGSWRAALVSAANARGLFRASLVE